MLGITQLLMMLYQKGGSDLHLSQGHYPMMRIHGELTRVENVPLDQTRMRTILKDLMTPEQLEKFDAQYSHDFAYELKDVARYRCNVFRQQRGVGIVLRIIPSQIKTAEELGLPQTIIDLAKSPRGLILVTGPTGSGKSTTLAAMIDYINQNRFGHIITIEDPIEFVHKTKNCRISQREVGHHSISFYDALRASLREDPNVILVGEMRDLETISLALTAAETGALVFGTLHTNSAPKTITRIIDAFPDEQREQIRIMLSKSIAGIVAQQLLRTKDGDGRVAAVEILRGSAGLGNIIREGKVQQIQSIMETGKGDGMQTMDQCLQGLVAKGIITQQEAYKKAINKSLFEGTIRQVQESSHDKKGTMTSNRSEFNTFIEKALQGGDKVSLIKIDLFGIDLFCDAAGQKIFGAFNTGLIGTILKNLRSYEHFYAPAIPTSIFVVLGSYAKADVTAKNLFDLLDPYVKESTHNYGQVNVSVSYALASPNISTVDAFIAATRDNLITGSPYSF